MTNLIPIKAASVGTLYQALIHSGNPRAVYAKRDLYTLLFLSLFGYLKPTITEAAASLYELLQVFTLKAREFEHDETDFVLIGGGRFGMFELEHKRVEEGMAILYLYHGRLYVVSLAREEHWNVFNDFRTFVWDRELSAFEFSTEDWLDIIPIHNKEQ